jgi:hypothetical protein
MFGKVTIIDPYNTMGTAPARDWRKHMGMDTSKPRRRHHWDDLKTGDLHAMLDERERLRSAVDQGKLTTAQYQQAKEQLRDRYDYDGAWEC